MLGAVLCVLTACTAPTPPVAKSQADTETFWVLDTAVVHKLETRVVMPVGAKPVRAFTRYYEPGFDHGRRVVFGLLTEDGDRQVHISDHTPISMDGGCSIVTLTYDVAKGQIMSIACNGVA